MRIIDSHFHWWPRSIFEQVCKRSAYPRAERNGRGGYNYVGEPGRPSLNSWAEWFDLHRQLEHMDGLGHQVSVVCSLGPFSIYFSDLPAEEGREDEVRGHHPLHRGAEVLDAQFVFAYRERHQAAGGLEIDACGDRQAAGPAEPLADEQRERGQGEQQEACFEDISELGQSAEHILKLNSGGPPSNA